MDSGRGSGMPLDPERGSEPGFFATPAFWSGGAPEGRPARPSDARAAPSHGGERDGCDDAARAIGGLLLGLGSTAATCSPSVARCRTLCGRQIDAGGRSRHNYAPGTRHRRCFLWFSGRFHGHNGDREGPLRWEALSLVLESASYPYQRMRMAPPAACASSHDVRVGGGCTS